MEARHRLLILLFIGLVFLFVLTLSKPPQTLTDSPAPPDQSESSLARISHPSSIGRIGSKHASERSSHWKLFEISDKGIRLVEARTLSGHPKRQRNPKAAGSLFYRVLTEKGDVLWQGSTRDPRRVFIDQINYQTATKNRKPLRGKVLMKPSGILDVRYPRHADSHVIEFYDLSQIVDLTERNRIAVIAIEKSP